MPTGAFPLAAGVSAEPGGHKVRPGVGRDRRGEPLDVQLDQGHNPVGRIRDPDRVERDVEVARLVDHGLEVLVHGLLVEGVDRRRLGGPAGGNDLLGDRFDRCPVAAGDKQRGPLAHKGAGDRAADGAAGAVEHRDLVGQQHRWFLSGRWRWFAWHARAGRVGGRHPKVHPGVEAVAAAGRYPRRRPGAQRPSGASVELDQSTRVSHSIWSAQRCGPGECWRRRRHLSCWGVLATLRKGLDPPSSDRGG